MIAALYKGEIPRLDIEFRYRGRDGTGAGRASTASWCADPTARARRMVGVTGDITETRQRERQLETAKAEAAAAHRDVEQAREVMQTVLDNMTDGVTLFDKDFRWQFSNRAHIDARSIRPECLSPGVSGRDMVRYQIERGDFGRGRRRRGAARRSRAAHPPARAATATSGARRTAATSNSTTSRSTTAACSASIATSPS